MLHYRYHTVLLWSKKSDPHTIFFCPEVPPAVIKLMWVCCLCLLFKYFGWIATDPLFQLQLNPGLGSRVAIHLSSFAVHLRFCAGRRYSLFPRPFTCGDFWGHCSFIAGLLQLHCRLSARCLHACFCCGIYDFWASCCTYRAGCGKVMRCIVDKVSKNKTVREPEVCHINRKWSASLLGWPQSDHSTSACNHSRGTSVP